MMKKKTMKKMNIKQLLSCSLFLILLSNFTLAKSAENISNPSIGVVADIVTNVHDADEEFKNDGLSIRTIELAIGANIDLYARLETNIMVNGEGVVELHEGYALFHSLPFSLQAKLGRELVSFGHVASFHTHALSTVYQPKVYKEYAGGVFVLDGLEASWLLPTPHYFELYGGIFNNMNGHTHDSDPSGSKVIGKYSCPNNPPPNCHCHGTEIHGDYDETMVETDAPVTSSSINKKFQDFAYFGKLKTTFELGNDFSIDMGTSALYSKHHTTSAIDEETQYSKMVNGNDITFFWHPLTSNSYRSFQLGLENVNTIYEDEKQVTDGETISIYKVDKTRIGLYGYTEFRQNNLIRYGVLGEAFQDVDDIDYLNKRYGAFFTISPSHFQYFRLEYSRYDKKNFTSPINSFSLQYDVVIGYHTHGDKR